MSFEIRHVDHRSPEPDRIAVLRFSSGDYLWASRSRLEAPWDGETYGIAAAFAGDQCIGTTAYTLSARGLGILAQVFTDPEYRRRGVASATVEEALGALRHRGARAVYLAAWREPVRALYRRFGFEFIGAMGERYAFKLTLDPSGSDDELFAPGQPTRLRPLAKGDQCDLCSLFNASHPGVVKHYELGCYLGSHFEGEFYTLLAAGDRLQASVLDGERTILGLATIMGSTRRHEQHRGIVDVVVHPAYAAQGPQLLEGLHAACPLRCLTAYAADGDESRRRLFEDAGYAAAGRFEEALLIGDRSYALTVYEKSPRVYNGG